MVITKNNYSYNTTYVNEPPNKTLPSTSLDAPLDYKRFNDQYKRQEYWTR